MNRKLFFQTASGISLAMILSGCAIPHKADPSLTLAAGGQVMSAAETAERYDINGDWWQVYQSPQLNALVNQALANNADLRQAAINVNKALYQANILGANLVPAFNGSLGASTSPWRIRTPSRIIRRCSSTGVPTYLAPPPRARSSSSGT